MKNHLNVQIYATCAAKSVVKYPKSCIDNSPEAAVGIPETQG